MNWRKLGNLPVIWLLRSPLHRLVSGSLLVLTVRGCRTGTPYTTPLNYVQDGDDLLILSRPERTWWRNLRGGAEVQLRLKGRTWIAHGDVIDDFTERRSALLDLTRRRPRYARYLNVSLSESGELVDPEKLDQTARDQVVIRLTGLESAITNIAGQGHHQQHDSEQLAP